MARSIEQGQSQNVEVESGVDIDLELRTKKYWHEFGFPGDPPRSGTPVMKQLLRSCQQYESYVSNPKLQGATGWEGGRRQTHEQLANMIFGRDLKSLGDDVRARLTEFACLVATGLDSNQLGELATQRVVEE